MKCSCGKGRKLKAHVYIDADGIPYPLVLCPECLADMEDRTDIVRQGNTFKVKQVETRA